MTVNRLIISVATLVALISVAIQQQAISPLAWLLASSLLFISGQLGMLSWPRYHWWLGGGLLLLQVGLSAINPLNWWLVPLATWSLMALAPSNWWLGGSFTVITLLGVGGLSMPMRLWYVGWSLAVAALAWNNYRQRQQRAKMLAQLDALRVAKNHYTALFQQGVVNASVREAQATAMERQRLVHEIHDELGHQLTGSLMQLQAAKISYRTDAHQGEQLLDQATTVVRAGIEDIRQILHTEQLARETVNVDQLQGTLQRFTDAYQIQTNLQYSGELTAIAPAQWQVLAANLQEILTNTLKYADARTVTATLRVYPQFIRLTVHNDGQAAPHYHPGLGLTGMVDRTANIGGQVLVDGASGFTVTTKLPRNT